MFVLRRRVVLGLLSLFMFFALAFVLIQQSVDVSQDKMVAAESGPEEALLLSADGREAYDGGNPYDESVALINMGDYSGDPLHLPHLPF